MTVPCTRASSAMFSASTMGRPVAASWDVSISPRLRFLASATWTTTSASPRSSMRRATSSSSVRTPSSAVMPGVSVISHTSPPSTTRPLVIATVVPG